MYLDPCWWKNTCLYNIQNIRSRKINGSTSFAIDSMYYVSFKIWEQECIPWCGEIQHRRSEVLGKTFNLRSNSTWCQRCVVSQSVSNERIKSVQHSHKNISFLMRTLMKDLMKSLMKKPYENLYVSLLIYITDYLIGLAFWTFPIGV